MLKEKIIEYLDKQFWKHKVYECMPENENGYEYVPREALSKIVDGLIPMIKSELKKSSIPLNICEWKSFDFGMMGFHDYEYKTSCGKNYDCEKVKKEKYCPNCGGKII